MADFNPLANIPAALQNDNIKSQGGFFFPESEVEHWLRDVSVNKHTGLEVKHIASTVVGRRALYR